MDRPWNKRKEKRRHDNGKQERKRNKIGGEHETSKILAHVWGKMTAKTSSSAAVAVITV